MDFRPATGELYAVTISGAGTFTGRLYKINTDTAAATLVGAGPFSTTLTSGTGIGMDFNPTVDRIRFTTNADTNLRLNPDDGTIAGTDTDITVANTVADVAYSNNYPGAASTTLYAIDFTNDDLDTIGGLNSNPSPNGGVGTKVGDINVATDPGTVDRVGLDILTTLEGGTAFYSGRFTNQYRLYTLNLTTAAATLVGAIGSGSTQVTDIAVQPPTALTFADGKSFTYTDGDGDLVTVKTTAGTLKSSQFFWLNSANGAQHELIGMNIANDVTFTGANLTFTAKKTATGGDGRVEVGTLNATAVNLGAVKIGGSLRIIIAGTNDAVIPAVKSLDLLSLGRIAGGNDVSTGVSIISGKLPLVKIKGDLAGANVTISGKVGSVFIGGSIIGSDGGSSGYLNLSSGAKSVFIGGSIVGGGGSSSGDLLLGADTGSVKIGGSIIGGVGGFSGRLSVAVGAKALTSLSVGGSILGGDGGTSGTVSYTNATAVSVGGSIVAGGGGGSGSVTGANTTTFKIGASVVGGSGVSSGEVGVDFLGTFTLGGSLIGGEPASGYSGGLHFSTVKSVLIKGSVTGQQGAAPALIGFAGKNSPATAAESIAIGSLTIKGSVTNAEILLGETLPGLVLRYDVGAGKIAIGGDFTASSITAGVSRGTDKFFGNADDVPGMITNAGIKATIASIVIKGRATGTSSDSDFYGIQAENLGTMSIAGRKLPLTAAAQDNVLAGIYGDFRVRELTFV